MLLTSTLGGFTRLPIILKISANQFTWTGSSYLKRLLPHKPEEASRSSSYCLDSKTCNINPKPQDIICCRYKTYLGSSYSKTACIVWSIHRRWPCWGQAVALDSRCRCFSKWTRWFRTLLSTISFTRLAWQRTSATSVHQRLSAAILDRINCERQWKAAQSLSFQPEFLESQVRNFCCIWLAAVAFALILRRDGVSTLRWPLWLKAWLLSVLLQLLPINYALKVLSVIWLHLIATAVHFYCDIKSADMNWIWL